MILSLHLELLKGEGKGNPSNSSTGFGLSILLSCRQAQVVPYSQDVAT